MPVSLEYLAALGKLKQALAPPAEKAFEKVPEKVPEKAPEVKVVESVPEKVPEKAPEVKVAEKVPEKAPEKAPEVKVADKVPDLATASPVEHAVKSPEHRRSRHNFSTHKHVAPPRPPPKEKKVWAWGDGLWGVCGGHAGPGYT